MPVPAHHAGRFVYHSTHLLNLEGILERGLLSCNEQTAQGLNHHSIAAQSIQQRRAEMVVPCGPRGFVHDYVPLYFTKLSPMLLQQVGSKNVDQILLLHFAFPISLLEREDVVFTDAAANSGTPPGFYSDPSHLMNLSWPAIDLRTWGSRIDGRDVKQQRMAEALVYRRLDPRDASFIVVWNDWVRDRVLEVYKKAGIAPPNLRYDEPGENHIFTHFRKELPAEMRGKSIAAGPYWINHVFEKTVKEIKDTAQGAPQPRFSSIDVLLHELRSNGLSVLRETEQLIGLESDNEVHQHDVGTHTLNVVQQLKNSARFKVLSQEDKDLVELAAFLHDIGKGPKEKWAGFGGRQQVDPDHPLRSTEMLPRILRDEIHLDDAFARILCKLVCYHDLVGDIISDKKRNRSQLADIAETVRDLDLLIALGEADMGSVNAFWGLTAQAAIPELREWVIGELSKAPRGEGSA